MSTASSSTRPELALAELKKQARRLGKIAGPDSNSPQHKHHLLTVARKAGFRDWQQARRVLLGEAGPSDDFGTLWVGRPGGGFLNEWFASYAEARLSWEGQSETAFLLPYKTQFVVVGQAMMEHLGIDVAVLEAKLDLIAEIGGPVWDSLCRQRLRAIFAAPFN